MAYALHTRVTLSGEFSITDSQPGPEIWTTTFNLGGHVNMDATELDDHIGHHLDVAFNDADAKIPTNCRMTNVKVSLIDTTNHVVGPVINLPRTIRGTSGQISPFQCSMVLSLRTGLRGPANRGRMYLPGWGLVVDGRTGQTSPTYGMAAAVVWKTCFDNIATAYATASPPSRLVVASSRDGNNPVTEILVGLVADTVRRRRNQLDEAYQAVTLA